MILDKINHEIAVLERYEKKITAKLSRGNYSCFDYQYYNSILFNTKRILSRLKFIAEGLVR